jgi:Lectin C-type domain
MHHFLNTLNVHNMRLGYNITSGFDIWTSATGKDSSRIEWCASTKEFVESNMNWKTGKPNRADGDCTAIFLSNVNANSTTLSQRNCMEKLRFVCEVCISSARIIYLLEYHEYYITGF